MSFPRMTAARLLRLSLKELRESLRDRRTIVTLLLMPLMVYPLLSLVLHRVVPSESPILVETSVRIGIGSQLRQSGMEAVILMGYTLLQDADTAPIFIETPVEDRPDRSTPKAALNALPIPVFVTINDSERQALRRSNVDIALVSKFPASRDEEPISLPAPLRSLLNELMQQQNLPEHLKISAEQLLQSLGRYEIAYRYGDSQSERALSLVERSLSAINALVTSKANSVETGSNYTIVGTPIAVRQGHVDLLATMIPLVLVLMTMAGAVYPAIDLTAGERERGTMEALVVSPTSPVWILLSKYTAVVIVALLTALANLGAMSLMLWFSGVGQIIFGNSPLNAATIGQVLALLILFTMFFAALLLAVTSFAKSFKEAQAYLIPLMLLALTPGVTSLMPGIQFTPVLATVPLVNIVLLAREVLQGDANWGTTVVTLVCNSIYAMASLTIASRLFGASAAVQGSQGSWRDWLTRRTTTQQRASVDQMALLLACIFPLHFILTSLVSRGIGSMPIRLFLIYCGSITWLATVIIPLAITWYQRIHWSTCFRLNSVSWRDWRLGTVALVLIVVGAWALQHQLSALTYQTGSGYTFQERSLATAVYDANFRNISVWLTFFSNVVTPAICMELLFRGLVISSLSRFSALATLLISAVLFALFDILASHVISLDRFLPTLIVGLILSWLSLRADSIFPCVTVSLLLLGIPQLMNYFESALPAWQFLNNRRNPLPASWQVLGLVTLSTGLVLFHKSLNPRRLLNLTNAANRPNLPAQEGSF